MPNRTLREHLWFPMLQSLLPGSRLSHRGQEHVPSCHGWASPFSKSRQRAECMQGLPCDPTFDASTPCTRWTWILLASCYDWGWVKWEIKKEKRRNIHLINTSLWNGELLRLVPWFCPLSQTLQGLVLWYILLGCHLRWRHPILTLVQVPDISASDQLPVNAPGKAVEDTL